jgi:hypothetical protein
VLVETGSGDSTSGHENLSAQNKRNWMHVAKQKLAPVGAKDKAEMISQCASIDGCLWRLLRLSIGRQRERLVRFSVLTPT